MGAGSGSGGFFEGFGEEGEEDQGGDGEEGAEDGGAGQEGAKVEVAAGSVGGDGFAEGPELGFVALFEGGADGEQVVVGRGEFFVADGEVVGGGGFGGPDEAVDGAPGADIGDGDGGIVGVLDDKAELGSALFREGDGEGVGGEAGEIDVLEAAVGNGAPGFTAVDEGGGLDGGVALEVAGGGIEVEAGDGGVMGVEGDFGGFGGAVGDGFQSGVGPFAEDGLVFAGDGFVVPEGDFIDAEGGLEEIEGAGCFLAFRLDETDEGLGALFGGVGDVDGEVATGVGGEGDFRAADVHVAGVVVDFGLGEEVPGLAVVAAGDADGADEVGEGGEDFEAVGGGGVLGDVEAGFDAVAGDFLKAEQFGGDGPAEEAGLGGVEGFDGARDFPEVGVEEAQVAEVGLGGGDEGGVELDGDGAGRL